MRPVSDSTHTFKTNWNCTPKWPYVRMVIYIYFYIFVINTTIPVRFFHGHYDIAYMSCKLFWSAKEVWKHVCHVLMACILLFKHMQDHCNSGVTSIIWYLEGGIQDYYDYVRLKKKTVDGSSPPHSFKYSFCVHPNVSNIQ